MIADFFRVAGRGPFYSKYNKETLSLNRDYILSFEDHRIQSLSMPGNLSFCISVC